MKCLRDMAPEYLRLMVWLQQREIQVLIEKKKREESLFEKS